MFILPKNWRQSVKCLKLHVQSLQNWFITTRNSIRDEVNCPANSKNVNRSMRAGTGRWLDGKMINGMRYRCFHRQSMNQLDRWRCLWPDMSSWCYKFGSTFLSGWCRKETQMGQTMGGTRASFPLSSSFCKWKPRLDRTALKLCFTFISRLLLWGVGFLFHFFLWTHGSSF